MTMIVLIYLISKITTAFVLRWSWPDPDEYDYPVSGISYYVNATSSHDACERTLGGQLRERIRRRADYLWPQVVQYADHFPLFYEPLRWTRSAYTTPIFESTWLMRFICVDIDRIHTRRLQYLHPFLPVQEPGYSSLGLYFIRCPYGHIVVYKKQEHEALADLNELLPLFYRRHTGYTQRFVTKATTQGRCVRLDRRILEIIVTGLRTCIDSTDVRIGPETSYQLVQDPEHPRGFRMVVLVTVPDREPGTEQNDLMRAEWFDVVDLTNKRHVGSSGSSSQFEFPVMEGHSYRACTEISRINNHNGGKHSLTQATLTIAQVTAV